MRMGVLRLTSTLWKNFEPGNAPSRPNAYIMREFDVIEKVPAKNMQTNITTCSRAASIQIPTYDMYGHRTISAMAPFSPTVSSRICVMGWPVLDPTVPL